MHIRKFKGINFFPACQAITEGFTEKSTKTKTTLTKRRLNSKEYDIWRLGLHNRNQIPTESQATLPTFPPHRVAVNIVLLSSNLLYRVERKIASEDIFCT